MATVHIILEIEGDTGVAFAAVDSVLDIGVLQDEINEYIDEREGYLGECDPLHVTSAVVAGPDAARDRQTIAYLLELRRNASEGAVSAIDTIIEGLKNGEHVK